MMTHFRPRGGSAARRLSAAVGIAILCSCFPGRAQAQTSNGGIRGLVKDNTGAVLAGVTAEATSPGLLGPIRHVTNQLGLYLFDRLPVNIYSSNSRCRGSRRSLVKTSASRLAEQSTWMWRWS
jgi:hypothetical protein